MKQKSAFVSVWRVIKMDPLLKKMVREGEISAIFPEKGTVRVKFDDDGTVSYELPIIFRGVIGTKDYWMPDIGEQVVCLFLPNGNARGFVIGAVYSNVNPPPVTDKNKRHVSFEDGTTIEYDTSTSTLTVDSAGPINIKANEINIEGDVIVTGDIVASDISLVKHTHMTPAGESDRPSR